MTQGKGIDGVADWLLVLGVILLFSFDPALQATAFGRARPLLWICSVRHGTARRTCLSWYSEQRALIDFFQTTQRCHGFVLHRGRRQVKGLLKHVLAAEDGVHDKIGKDDPGCISRQF